MRTGHELQLERLPEEVKERPDGLLRLHFREQDALVGAVHAEAHGTLGAQPELDARAALHHVGRQLRDRHIYIRIAQITRNRLLVEAYCADARWHTCIAQNPSFCVRCGTAEAGRQSLLSFSSACAGFTFVKPITSVPGTPSFRSTTCAPAPAPHTCVAHVESRAMNFY